MVSALALPVARSVVLVSVAVATGGCVSRVHAPYNGPADDRTTGVRHASLEVPRGVREEIIESGPRHRQVAVVMPSVGANGQPGNLVKATLHQGLAPGRKRMVAVLPIWGSSKYPSGRVVRRLLAGRGSERTNVLVVHGERALFDWDGIAAARDEAELGRRISETAERLQNTATDVRRLLTWAETRGEADPARLGIVGFSMGALVGSLVMGQDERLAAGAFIMGGANLHQIFASCRGRPGETRAKVTRHFGWDAETFGRKIENGLAPVNPARFASGIHPSRVLLVDSAHDHCMPESSRTDLWQAMGRPERITLSYGHQIAFLSMSPLGFDYITRRIVGFLDRLLAMDPQPAPSPPATSVAARVPG